MTTLRVDHLGGDRYGITIRGHWLVSDQPGAGGDDEDQGPTPTELFVAGLASCAAFYVGRFLRRHTPTENGFAVECGFRMSESPPSRVASIELKVVLEESVSDDLRAAVSRVAEHCTVHNSLVNPPSVTISVASGDAAGERAEVARLPA